MSQTRASRREGLFGGGRPDTHAPDRGESATAGVIQADSTHDRLRHGRWLHSIPAARVVPPNRPASGHLDDPVDESPPISEPIEIPGPATAEPSAPAFFGIRTFVMSAGVLSLSAVSNLVRAIITAKLLALALGPSLTGDLAQILNFSAFLFQIIPLGLTTGVAKLVADSPSDRARVGA